MSSPQPPVHPGPHTDSRTDVGLADVGLADVGLASHSSRDPRYEATPLSITDFDAFAAQAPGSNVVQSGLTVRIAKARGREVVVLGVKRDGVLVAAGAFFVRRDRFGIKLADCRKGPLLDYGDADTLDNALTSFKDALRSHGVATLRISPNIDRYVCDEHGQERADGRDNRHIHRKVIGCGFHHQGDAVNPNNPHTTSVRDLHGLADAAEALRTCDHHTRKAIRKAERNGVTVVATEPPGLDRVYAALVAAKQAKGATDHQGKDYYAHALRLQGEGAGEAHLWTGEIDVAQFRDRTSRELDELRRRLVKLETKSSMRDRKQMPAVREKIAAATAALEGSLDLPAEGSSVAAVLFFMAHGNTVTALVGGTVPGYEYFNAFSLLYFRMMVWAVEHGYSMLDFYGTWGWDDPSSDGYGNYRFKRGFGGSPRVLLGEYQTALRRDLHTVHTLGTEATRAGRAVRQAWALRRG